MEHLFPFGQRLKRVEQKERTPKDVFVLGVYASAVHAKWVDVNNKTVCRALAVASEPYIFWDGDMSEAKQIIDAINIPPELGRIEPANKAYNGPSAKTLDENILKPLGVTRADAWLCDLLPESRLNAGQQKAIERSYKPLISKYGLNPVTVPIVPNTYCDDVRCDEITREIKESKATTIVLLGDVPIKQYLKFAADIDFSSLRVYSEKYGYGSPYPTVIDGVKVDIIPIAHPRQIAKLGQSNLHWFGEHKKWKEQGEHK